MPAWLYTGCSLGASRKKCIIRNRTHLQVQSSFSWFKILYLCSPQFIFWLKHTDWAPNGRCLDRLTLTDNRFEQQGVKLLFSQPEVCIWDYLVRISPLTDGKPIRGKTVCNWAFRAVWSLSFDPHGLRLHTLTSLFETLTVFSVRILRYNNIDMTENKEKHNRSPLAQYSILQPKPLISQM